jgi:hypothetical protein
MHAEIFVQDLAQRHAPVLPAAATAALGRQRRHLHACATTTVIPADQEKGQKQQAL